VRSRQTAEILRTSGLTQVEESTYLAPGGDIYAWLRSLEQWHQCLKLWRLLVINRTLGQWAEILIWGEARDKPGAEESRYYWFDTTKKLVH